MSKRIQLAISFILLCICSKAQSEQEVRVHNPASGAWLGGTLSLPACQPRAAVFLITGSGAQDRDETVMGHKLFKAIAQALQESGYAVLRVDDRGVGASDAGPANPTTDDFATDAAACLAFLDSVTAPNTPLGYIGHSEGATIAIKEASRNPKCKFIVTLGAPALRGDSILLSQVRRSLANSGQVALWEKTRAQVRQRYDLLMSDAPGFVAEAAIFAEIAKEQPAVNITDAVRQKVMAEIKAMASPWFRNFLRYDPAPDIQAVAIPWLAIGGGKDQQVEPENQEIIERLCPSAQIANFPGLNHLMLQAPTGAVDEYKTLIGDIDPMVTDRIVDFLNSLTTQNN